MSGQHLLESSSALTPVEETGMTVQTKVLPVAAPPPTVTAGKGQLLTTPSQERKKSGIMRGWIPGGSRRGKRVHKPWEVENIKCRECVYFVEDKKGESPEDPICGCGMPKSYRTHKKTSTNKEKWDSKRHTKRVKTNAFGRLKFVDEDGTHQPNFVRIADDFHEERWLPFVMKLLESRWRLPRPSLLISVTGGAKSFGCSYELTAAFKKGLMEAAKSTNAWIITGGTNDGVMKLVGEAVRGTSFGSQIPTIGIATWGIVKNRNQLEQTDRDSSLGNNPTDFEIQQAKYKPTFEYKTKSSSYASGAFLDPNHTHFFLVDNGSQNKYGQEIKFRAAVEQHISESFKREGQTLPQICVLVEGGPNSVETLLETVSLGNPALVLAGSGRAADVIAAAYHLSTVDEAFSGDGQLCTVRSLSEQNKVIVKNKIWEMFGDLAEAKKKSILEMTVQLISHDQLLTVYRLEDSRDFDYALLLALIKSIRGLDSGAAMFQMKLAITWNRPQLARDFILQKFKFNDQELMDLLEYSVIHDRCEFVKMILDQGADMKHFLDVAMLEKLYNTLDKKTMCWKMLKKIKKANFANKVNKWHFKLQDINIVGFLSAFDTSRLGSDDKLDLKLTDIGMLMEVILEGTYRSPFRDMQEQRSFDNPYDLMVVFAVLMQSHDLALLFWGKCQSPIATGLIAYKINTFLADVQSKRLQRDEDFEAELRAHASEFEGHATGVMNQCFKQFDKQHWVMVLTEKRSNWSDLTLVDLAIITGAYQFIAQGATQSWLSDIWLGKLHSTQASLSVVLCLPPPLPLLLRYTKTEGEEPVVTASESSEIKVNNTVNFIRVKEATDDYVAPNQTPVPNKQDIELDYQDEADEECDHLDGGPTTCIEPSTVTHTVAGKRKLGAWEKLVAYYTAPVVKFNTYTLTYIIFVTLYAYTILVRPENVPSVGETPFTVVDLIVLSYVLSSVPIEIRQILETNPTSLRYKIADYLKSFFNVMDILAIVLFFTSFIMKAFVSEKRIPVEGGLTMHSLQYLFYMMAFICYIVRFIQVFQIHRAIGPKIVMIGKMMVDLFFFIFLMAIFLIGYGVSAQGLLRPNRATFTGRTVFDVIFRPYLHVFGELDLDGMNAELVEGHCTANDTSCDIDVVRADDTGGLHYYVVMALLASYLMFVNILLLNLLIAIFSNTYANIENESGVIWKVQRANMILEYRDFLAIPQPFSLLAYLYYLVKWCIKKCYANCCKDTNVLQGIDDSKMYIINMLEAESREYYRAKKDEEADGENSRIMREIKNNHNVLKSMLKQGGGGARKMLGATGKMETKKDLMSAKSSSQISYPTKHPELSRKLTRIKPLRVHQDSRQSPYPGTTVQRFAVSDDKVSWVTPYAKYAPVDYTSPKIKQAASDETDPQHINPTLKSNFNKVEKAPASAKASKTWSVNRKSYSGLFDLVDGVPRNPRGRTGMKGRGCLHRWGPNHATDTIVTRWARDPDNEIITIDGKQVLEFVAIMRKDCNQWAIPGGRVKPHEKVFDAIKREFSTEALATLSKSDEEQKRISQMLTEHFNLGITVYKGYVDDPRNTDNSWIETLAVNYHDSIGTSFSNFPLQAEGDSLGVQWIAIKENIDLYANHEWIIEKVCYHRDAYNPIVESKKANTDLWLTQ